MKRTVRTRDRRPIQEASYEVGEGAHRADVSRPDLQQDVAARERQRPLMSELDAVQYLHPEREETDPEADAMLDVEE